MNFTDQDKHEFLKLFTEELIKDKGLGEAISKIKFNTENPEGGQVETKEVKTVRFFKSLMNRDFATAKSISGATADDGAVLIPEEFKADIIDLTSKSLTALRGLVRTVPVSFRSGTVPTLEEGVVVQWSKSDSDTSSDKKQKPKFAELKYTVNRLEGYTAISNDTLNDSPIAIYNLLVELYSEAFIKAENMAIIRGTGTDQPVGISKKAKEIAVSSEAINTDMLIGLQYEVPKALRSGAVYIANTNVVKAMRLMKDANGQYLWTSAREGELPTFAGYPVYEMEEADNEVFFANFKHYMLFDRGEYSLDVNTTSDAAFFGNKTIMKLANRLDGKPSNAKAFVKLTGYTA